MSQQLATRLPSSPLHRRRLLKQPVLRSAGLAVVGGLLMLAAFPPVGWWWAAPVGLAALLAAGHRQGLRRAAWLALLAHLVLFAPLLEWTRFLGPAPWLALVVLQALLSAALGPLVVLVERACRAGTRSRLLGPVGLVGAVVAVEAVRARVPFGGLTWGRLAFGQSDGPLLVWAALGGAPAVTAATALTAIALLAAARLARRAVFPPQAVPPDNGRPSRPSVPAAVLALAVLPVLLLGGALVATPTGGVPVQVAAVQGNVPGQGLDALAEDLVVLDNHLEQTRRLAAQVAAGELPAPDLVIWPENAADQDPRIQRDARSRLDAAVTALGGRPLLLGAVLRDGTATGGTTTSNALLAWGPSGVQGAVYRKRHLVPFGEYLPMRELIQQIYPAAGRLLPRDFTPGNRVGRVDLAGVPLAVGTCFEVTFDDLPRQAVRAGGQLLVLPSNNASYGRSAQSAQQLAMARLRAVEHGRSTVVATTSGISALITADGQVLARSGLYEPAILTASLPRRTDLTFATRHGPAVEAALVGCCSPHCY